MEKNGYNLSDIETACELLQQQLLLLSNRRRELAEQLTAVERDIARVVKVVQSVPDVLSLSLEQTAQKQQTLEPACFLETIRGKKVKLDPEDYEQFKNVKIIDHNVWGTRFATSEGKTLALHRVIAGASPEEVVLFRNSDRYDCRKSNLLKLNQSTYRRSVFERSYKLKGEPSELQSAERGETDQL